MVDAEERLAELHKRGKYFPPAKPTSTEPVNGSVISVVPAIHDLKEHMTKIGQDVDDFNAARRKFDELLDIIANTVAVTTQFRGYYEQLQRQLDVILSSIEASKNPVDIQKLLDQFVRDIRAEIQRSSLALRGGGGGAVPGAATEATLTAMKGAGWANESLKAIKDVVDGLGGGAGTATIEKQNQILDGTVDLSGGWAAGTDNLHDIYVKLDVLDDLVDDLETRLTAVRAGYLDNLSAGAVALAGTALSTATWTGARAGYLDELAAANLPTDVDLLKTRNLFSKSSAATGNGAVDGTTIVDAGLTEANDYWNGLTLLITSGACIGQAREITDFVAASDTVTVYPAFSAQVLSGVTYLILGVRSGENNVLSGFSLLVADTGTTSGAGNVGGTTLVDAAKTQAEDYWVGSNILILSGANNGQTRRITAFANATGTFTVAAAFQAQVAATVDYAILPGRADIDTAIADIHTDVGDIHTDVGTVDTVVDAIKLRTDNRLTWTTFFSPPVAEVVADTSHTDAAMPTVTIPNWTGTVVHVYVGFTCRKIENTGAANALNGAQEIQINKAGGGWTDGINLVTDMFGMGATTIEAGPTVFGIIDLVGTIDVFNTTCQFQWDEPLTDVDALHFNDLQTFVIIGWY